MTDAPKPGAASRPGVPSKNGDVAAWCNEDPGIRSGWLRVEIHPWFSARGITTVPPA